MSSVEEYIKSKKWSFQEAGSDQFQIEECPFCHDCKYHLYINQENGLWHCHKCGESGNLNKIKAHLGDSTSRFATIQGTGREPGELPDIEAAKYRLSQNEDALDYLVAERGFTMKVIDKQQLGLSYFDGKPFLLIPYFVGGQLVNAKWRSLPPAKKEFRNVHGREIPLYNQDVLQPGLKELVICEGEADLLALLSAGIDNVVGVPGANIKKAAWLDKLDEVAPEKIYLCYDNDKVGQDAAREIASRIGLDKVWNIALPSFNKVDGTPGKDINEWLRIGNDAAKFEELKKAAKPFDVLGVSRLTEALNDFEHELEAKDSMAAKYATPWPSLNAVLGGAEIGDVVDILATAKVGKSTLSLNWADFVVQNYNDSVLFYCLEMTHTRLVRKWVSMVTQTDDSPAKTTEEAKSRLDSMKQAVSLAKEIAGKREADLLFAYNRVTKPEDVYETIRQAVRRYGVKFVVFDNIQLLADMTLQNLHNRTVHISKISKTFKALATELGIVIVRIVQPNRVKDNEIAGASNADGSSQIEKDCDAMIVLHRNEAAPMKKSEFQQVKYLEAEGTFEPQMLCRVVLSRYAGGGACTLMIDGAKSTVREWNDTELGAIETHSNDLATMDL